MSSLASAQIAGLYNRLLLLADALPGFDLGLEASVEGTADLLVEIVERIGSSGDNKYIWLLQAVLLAKLPSTAEVEALRRAMMLESSDEVCIGLLKNLDIGGLPDASRDIDIVRSKPVVEADYTFGNNHMRGIGRVVRNTIERWAAKRDFVLVDWDKSVPAFRRLSMTNALQVFEDANPSVYSVAEGEVGKIVIPFDVEVIMPDSEILDFDLSDRIACMSRFSANRLCFVGYDLIPITSQDLRPGGEANHTGALVAAWKYADKIACISDSSYAEFAGLLSGLVTQGLPIPSIREITLPSHVAKAVAHSTDNDSITERSPQIPVVLGLGTLELHKNPINVLLAVELLWRKGVDFEFRQIGDRGWFTEEYYALAEELKKEGAPITLLGRVSDEVLWREMRDATVSVFASFHEGYGLPVVESLSVGTPVVTTNYGSQAQIATRGGCLTVDPNSVEEISDAIQSLLTDNALRSRLMESYNAAEKYTWDSYADDLWNYFTGPTGVRNAAEL